MSYNKFNFDGREYNMKPLPLVDKKKKIRRKTMFDKNYVSLELILFSLGCVVAFSAGLIGLMKWLA